MWKWKTLGILALMLVCGVATLIVAAIFLMYMPAPHGYENYGYEWAGQFPALVFGPAVAGFLAPGILVWLGRRRGIRTLSIILGSFAGAGVGFFVSGLGLMAVGNPLYEFNWAVNSSGLCDPLVPIFCGFIGFSQGALGVFSGTWRRGLRIGVIVAVLNCCWWLALAWYLLPGAKVWGVSVWLIAGASAGAVGSVVRQRLSKKAAPAKAEMGAPMAPTQQSSQRGRDALLINGIALLFFVAAYLVGRLLAPMYLTAEPLAGTLWIAAYTLFCWSLVLAARALRRGEPKRWPVIVCCALGLEIAALFLSFWFSA